MIYSAKIQFQPVSLDENMKLTRSLMGMHITVEVVDSHAKKDDIDDVYEYFTYVDNKFSTYKDSSEISQINNGKLEKARYSNDMKIILKLCEQTRQVTDGYFNIEHAGKLDPSGIVKGWAILQASKLLEKKGFRNFYIDAGGDIQVAGKNSAGEPWRIGIRDPFKPEQIVKVLGLSSGGVVTSGTSVRGQHIYNPHRPDAQILEIMSITVIGPDVYEADRFATAAFAMGTAGIFFIKKMSGFEAYMIDKDGIATYTKGFRKFVTR